MEKYFHFNRYKTLEELDGEDWGYPEFTSHLVTTCHELRKKPLSYFEVEDFRIMIGQNFCLDFLVPLALEILDDNIYSEGDYYSGDLLEALLRVDKDFWKNNIAYKTDLENILEKNIKDLNSKLFSYHNKFS